MKIFLLILITLLSIAPARAAVEAGTDISAQINDDLALKERRKQASIEDRRIRELRKQAINSQISKINSLSGKQLQRWYASDRSDAALDHIIATPNAVTTEASASEDEAAVSDNLSGTANNRTFRRVRLSIVVIIAFGLMVLWTLQRRASKTNSSEL